MSIRCVSSSTPSLPLRVPDEVLQGGQAPGTDPYYQRGQASFHITPKAGWCSDPHGPIFYKGLYHLFYQGKEATCTWWFGLSWHHVVSADLVHWVRLPPAIVPTPGSMDADGAFSGNICIHPQSGRPMLFYTGIRRKHNVEAMAAFPEPPPTCMNPKGMQFECQLCAVAAEDDDLLVNWVKCDAPWQETPHCAFLSSWRDPFFVGPTLNPSTGRPLNEEYPHIACAPSGEGTGMRPATALQTQGSRITAIVGSGFDAAGMGGTALVYETSDPAHGWAHTGYLCSWPSRLCGQCWECPFLCHLPDLPPGVHSLVCLSDPRSLEPKTESQPTPVDKAARVFDEATRRAFNVGAYATVQETEREAAEQGRDVESAVAAAIAPLLAIGPVLPNKRTPTATALLSAEPLAATREMLAKAAAAGAEGPAGVISSRAAPEASSQAAEASMQAHRAAHLALGAALEATEKDRQKAVLPGDLADAEHDLSGIPLNKEASSSEMLAREYILKHSASSCKDLGMPSPSAQVVRRVAGQLPLVPAPAAPGQRWLFGFASHAATYSPVWMIGDYMNGRFDLDTAQGPFKLDIGNTLFAPVCFYDPKEGRQLVCGYIRELCLVPRPPIQCNKYADAGCTCLMRALHLKDGRLFQTPLPEMAGLRTGRAWTITNRSLSMQSPLTIPEDPGQYAHTRDEDISPSAGPVSGDHLDIELVVRQGTASHTVLLLDSWLPGRRGAGALVFSWDSKDLKMVFDAHMHPEQWGLPPSISNAHGTTQQQQQQQQPHKATNVDNLGGLHTLFDEDGVAYQVIADELLKPVPEEDQSVAPWLKMDMKKAGGRLLMSHDDPLALRIFVDGSVIEVFTGCGQVLTTRLDRGHPGVEGATNSAISSTNLQLRSVAGECIIARAEVHECESCWLRREDAQLPPPCSSFSFMQWKKVVQDWKKAAP